MAFSLAVRADRSDELKKEYTTRLDNMNLQEVVKEFISYLEYTEESDSGTKVHPITVSSCRVLMSEPLSMCLSKLRSLSSGETK